MVSNTEGVIKEGSIAQFMRKRTQLVGFSIERHKHTQYVAEFLDNALDAIETAQWDFNIYKNLSPESPIQSYRVEPWSETLNKNKPEAILSRLNKLISPLKDLINKEPIALIVLQKVEKPEILPDDIQGSDIEMYCFEAFDNGVGMKPVDVEKFGIYLASSKSEKLKQTRGSQGFGAPSAFSDAQNTTGKPITVVTKHIKEKKGVLQVFYTTGENKKKYTIPSTQVSLPFDHGTYVQLWYLNVKYVKGYADEYVKQSALLNSHVNLIFIDPNGDVWLYPRKVSHFPPEPVYTEPHPESTSIGDFQEAVRNTSAVKVTEFLTKSFCRIGEKRAEEIVRLANKSLKSKLAPSTPVKSLTDEQINALYKAFISIKYPAPPVNTVVPVGSDVLRDVIKKSLNAEFVEAVTRKPTSSKGLAFVVEAAIAYKRPSNESSQNESELDKGPVLYRFTNRTPKLRDNSDCAIWKAASLVNWKNYKLDISDNGLPKGPVKLFVNVSGPFVHVMFKAQSKQALAADDILVKEIKLALEELGRKLKAYITKGEIEEKKKERSSKLLGYAESFVKSLTSIIDTDKDLAEKPSFEELYSILESMITGGKLSSRIKTSLIEAKNKIASQP
ncbi:MAG: DNA topoisomerase VI subunit B [Candidatus Odinarchaeum yellowstonii]|uniref:DNA topoisomerase VI subunit B n=1 Tax=Odinarchaeota yellowstonii (strain LCB_4) TaxID=1841599 RepID=A0AAF0D2N0_ODILC|nr:MAG: DNA topoisomerase VI subunit B [Candidatus Odinarchaeum yellowstonii]